MDIFKAFDLTGKVAVVTGGNAGLGHAFSTALASAGATVAVAGRTAQRSAAVAHEITESGGHAVAVDVDVTDRVQVQHMVDHISERLGPIDILFNNAGVCFHRPTLDVPEDEWHTVFDVNVHGVWHCAQEVGRQMVKQRSGVIINIGSMSATSVNRPQMQPAYNASKAAVHHLTRSLAAE